MRNTHAQSASSCASAAEAEVKTWHKAVVKDLISWCQALQRLPLEVPGVDGSSTKSALQNELRERLLSDIHALMLLSCSGGKAVASADGSTDGMTEAPNERELESSSISLAPVPEVQETTSQNATYPTLLNTSRSSKPSAGAAERRAGAHKEDQFNGNASSPVSEAKLTSRSCSKREPSSGTTQRKVRPASSEGRPATKEDNSMARSRTASWTPRRRSVGKPNISQVKSHDSGLKMAVPCMPSGTAMAPGTENAPRVQFQMPAFAGVRTSSPPRSPVRKQGSLRPPSTGKPSRSEALVMLAASLHRQLEINSSPALNTRAD